MNERIRELRKTLGLTMEKFGKRIGVAKSTISNIENGNRTPTEHMKKSICREFNVDPYWLETGEGEMFIETDEAFFAKIDKILGGENDSLKNLFRMMATLNAEDLHLIENMVHKLWELNQKEN